MSAQLNQSESSAAASFWNLVSPGRRLPIAVVAAGLAIAAWGAAVWQVQMPVWGATLIAVGILAIPAGLKWQDDLRRYGFAVAFLSVLLALQSFHTLEHITQVLQYYVLDRPPAQSFGLISALNAEWVHFTWNWLVVAALVVLMRLGLRNFFAWALLVWAVAHSIEHTYMLTRYIQMLNELSKLGVAALPSTQALPGILGKDGLLAASAICGRIPGLTTASRIQVHFWWNAGEITLLVLAAWRGMPELARRAGAGE